jgi:hypothetical protein
MAQPRGYALGVTLNTRDALSGPRLHRISNTKNSLLKQAIDLLQIIATKTNDSTRTVRESGSSYSEAARP